MGKKKYFEPVTVYAQLREDYIENKGRMSLSALGKMLGISASTVSRIENGETIPTTDILLKYSEIFDVPLDYFGEREMNKEERNVTLKKMGLTEKTVETLAMVKNASNHTENIIALLNAIIGNEEDTICFLHGLYTYLEMDYLNQQLGIKDNQPMEAFMLSSFKNYLDSVIKPQMKTTLKKSCDMKNKITEITEHEISYEEHLEIEKYFRKIE